MDFPLTVNLLQYSFNTTYPFKTLDEAGEMYS